MDTGQQQDSRHNSPEEANHDAALMLGKNYADLEAALPADWNGNIISLHRDITGAGGWTDLSELFYTLNAIYDAVHQELEESIGSARFAHPREKLILRDISRAQHPQPPLFRRIRHFFFVRTTGTGQKRRTYLLVGSASTHAGRRNKYHSLPVSAPAACGVHAGVLQKKNIACTDRVW